MVTMGKVQVRDGHLGYNTEPECIACIGIYSQSFFFVSVCERDALIDGTFTGVKCSSEICRPTVPIEGDACDSTLRAFARCVIYLSHEVMQRHDKRLELWNRRAQPLHYADKLLQLASSIWQIHFQKGFNPRWVVSDALM